MHIDWRSNFRLGANYLVIRLQKLEQRSPLISSAPDPWDDAADLTRRIIQATGPPMRRYKLARIAEIEIALSCNIGKDAKSALGPERCTQEIIVLFSVNWLEVQV